MTGRPAIFVTRRLPEAVTGRLTRDYHARLNVDDRVYSRNEIIAGATDLRADALLVYPSDQLTDEMIGSLPASIRAIATFSVGFEHIDLAAAGKRGIVVTNTPDVLTDATADIAMLLILGAARRASEGDRLVRQNRWNSSSTTFMLGTHVTGKRLGILGMGRIGQAIARRGALGFGMRVIYHNRSRLAPELEAPIGACWVEKAELLRRADHLVLVVPYSPASHHAIGAAELAQMKPTATLTNVARGGVVDDAALAQALAERRIAAAGLDVFEGEPRVHPALLDVPNVVLTPHIASATAATRLKMAMLAADNLIAVLGGQPALTPVRA